MGKGGTLPTPPIADDWDRATKRDEKIRGGKTKRKKLSIERLPLNKIERPLRQLIRGRVQQKPCKY
jgi:hypothetical protein